MITPPHRSPRADPESNSPRSGAIPRVNDLDRLAPDRRSRVVLLLRLLSLMVMVGALAVVGLGRIQWVKSLVVAIFPNTAAPVTSSLTASGTALAGYASPTDMATPGAGSSASGDSPLDRTRVASEDGLAILAFSEGARAFDASGTRLALDTITLTGMEVPLRTEVAIVGMAYTIGPEGVSFAPPPELTIRYDPSAYYPFTYEMAVCDFMEMVYLNVAANSLKVPWLEATVDSVRHSLRAQADHSGTLVIFCHVLGDPISMNGPGDPEGTEGCAVSFLERRVPVHSDSDGIAAWPPSRCVGGDKGIMASRVDGCRGA